MTFRNGIRMICDRKNSLIHEDIIGSSIFARNFVLFAGFSSILGAECLQKKKGRKLEQIYKNFTADSKIVLHSQHPFTIFVNIFPHHLTVGGGTFAAATAAFREDGIKNVDECWRVIGIHAQTRNIPRKFRTFEEANGEDAAEATERRSWRRFVTWLGRQTDLSFRLHGGLLGGRGVHYSSLIRGEKSEANWKTKVRERAGEVGHGGDARWMRRRGGGVKRRGMWGLMRDLSSYPRSAAATPSR